MKKCKYCGTFNENSAIRCSGCTANDFIYICDNCGSEITNGNYCSRCGVKFGSVRQLCPKCGTSYYTNACPNCGYSRNLSAARPSGAETIPSPPVIRVETVRTEAPRKKRSGWATFGLVLLWIYFLPIMATIAVWKSKKIPTLLKWAITFGIWGLTLAIYASSSQSSDSSSAETLGVLIQNIV